MYYNFISEQNNNSCKPLLFQAPLPPPVWKTPFDAIDKHVICPQPDLYFISNNVVRQEDCLIANVFVPDTAKTNLSVLVYIHGGGFIGGFGELFKTKRFLDKKDMIVVTFNYRLGIHGFLCLGTDNVPGNAGMKDQVALLRWVQKNIASYGGNPDDVTVAGYSAGSVSIDLLMLSKSAEGLFHRTIPESGANLAIFSAQVNPLEFAKTEAKRLNFTDVDDIDALENFYITAPWSLLNSAEDFLGRTDSVIVFTPCIERKTEEEAFLTESPLSILQRDSYKKVPMLYGFNNMEGLIRVPYLALYRDAMNENFSDFLPGNLIFKSDEEKREVGDKVKQFYFGNEPVSEENVLGFIDFFSDVMFTHSMLWTAKLYVEAGNDQVYLYEYSFADEDTPFVPYTNVRGAGHSFQTMALMLGRNMTHSSESDLTPANKNMKKIMREIWHNFIKTGYVIVSQHLSFVNFS